MTANLPQRRCLCSWAAYLLLLLSLLALPAQAKQITLNLKGVDIRNFVETIAEATGKNFILDPGVKGKITVISNKPMAEDELYWVFLSVLEVHGYIAVPSTNGGTIKILPDSQLKNSATPKLAENEESDLPEGVVIRIFDLHHVDANKALPTLRPLISAKGHMGALENNMIIASDHADAIDKLAKIIQRIDQPGRVDMDVIPLNHSHASELARVLNTMQGSSKEGGQNAHIAADEHTNSLLISGDSTQRQRLKTIITRLDKQAEGGGNTQVIRLNHAKSDDMVKVLKNLGEKFYKEQNKGKQENTTSQDGASQDVQSYPLANALVITAPPELMRNMQKVIQQLDVRLPQVQVDAVIAEITSNRALELGIQWSIPPSVNHPGLLGGTNFQKGTDNSITSLAANPTKQGAGLTMGVMDGTRTLLGTTSLNLIGLLRALGNDGSTNVISTPTVVTMDNAEAEIVVGQNVPFITGSYLPGNATAQSPFQTIKRENVGLTLRVKPQVNEGDTIRLEIHQEVSNVDATAVTASDLITRTRSIKTTVLVDDGHILVLGGLITDNLQHNMEKIPLLGDIPVLGSLFSYQKSGSEKNNLMVFLQPTILRDQRQGDKVSHSRYQEMRARQQEFSRKDSAVSPSFPTSQLAVPNLDLLTHQERLRHQEDE